MQLKAAKFLQPFRFIIEKTGANYQQVSHLVDLRFLLDNRKVNPTSTKKNQDPKYTLVRQTLMFVMVGTFFSLMLYKLPNPFLYALIMQSFVSVMVAITMMAEYSVALFDTRDNNIILPLPVNGQTIGWARVLHILLFMLLLALSLSLPAVVVIGIKFGALSSILFFAGTILNTLFTLFFTLFIYLGLMKFTTGEKLKDIMMYIQVGLTILIMVGYQLVPRNLSPTEGTDVVYQISHYMLLVPPAWFAMLSSVHLLTSITALVGSLLAIAVPIVAMVFIGKKLFYGFDSKLAQLNVTSGKKKTETGRLQKEESWWFSTTAPVFVIGTPEKVF